MPDTNSDNKTFYVGLCMAGAVSAGAYTAGVVDYLFEALSQWETRRGQEGIPSHRVEIPVIGGASAGGMTGIITASALTGKINPVNKPGQDILARRIDNKLYQTWVDLIADDMFPLLLDTSDMKNGKVLSALNSDFIKKIADGVVNVSPEHVQPLPPFISKDLRIFTTLTNLQGFEYDVKYKTSLEKMGSYYMQAHNDYACFQLVDKEITGPNEGWIPLNFPKKINHILAGEAAMATGAFPVGLQSRKVNRKVMYLNANSWLTALATNPLPNQGADHTTLNVDGGMINNEPFEKVRDVLNKLTGQSVSAEYENFNLAKSTVLLIDPFPSSQAKAFDFNDGLTSVMGKTLSAMISQLRTKPIDVHNAMSDTDASQYMIGPSRMVPQLDKKFKYEEGEKAIACGALDGFSGFISKEFRIHDFFLGRHNCKKFLRDYFTVPKSAIENNPILRNGYAGIDLTKHESTVDKDWYQIIPVFEGDTDYEFPAFKYTSGENWPVLNEADIERFRHAMKKRVQELLMNIIHTNGIKKGLLWVGAKVLLNGKLADAALDTMKNDLENWQLMRRKK